MAPTSPQGRSVPSDDELDNILRDIAEGKDVTGTTDSQTQQYLPKESYGDGLGIDEEIIVTKKRIPIPKLDENRLLSDPGIPRLRKISKERLRFKGKGHEYGDIARMLNMYQLWLDDLYPRAKFADALAITEKVGHTKRMQIMRKEWIDEGKPRRTSERDDEAADHVRPGEAPAEQTPESMEGVEQGGTTIEPESGREAPAEDDNSGMPDGDPDDDELDALLAESARPNSSSSKTLPSRTANADHDPFADEMEAMADMDDLW